MSDVVNALTPTKLESNTIPPRYKAHTFSSSLIPTTHDEIERVVHSYKSGSFYSLKKLPSSIKPGEIENSRIKNICRNRMSKPSDAFKSSNTNSLFNPLEYQFSDYSKMENLRKIEVDEKNLRMQSFSRKPFSYPSSRVKLKHESFFEDSNYNYPILGPSDRIISLDQILRPELGDLSKFYAGPFLVSGGKTKKVDDINKSRYQINEWMTRMFTKLQDDWPHYRFNIKYTDEEEVIFDFDLSLINDKVPLKRYMKHLAMHGLAAQFRLKKRGDRWDVVEEGALIFAFYVPWVINTQSKVNKNIATQCRNLTRRRNDEVQEKIDNEEEAFLEEWNQNQNQIPSSDRPPSPNSNFQQSLTNSQLPQLVQKSNRF